MNKKDKILSIIETIKEQSEEILESQASDNLNPEEIVIAATEIVLNSPVTTIQYNQPIGIVDRGKVTFMLDEEYEFPLFGDQYYEQE